ncbi:MAG: DUF3788 family protein [Flavobacteriales bacterium]|nr:DUF3788 family protein [Flavobacteriales bacterium]
MSTIETSQDPTHTPSESDLIDRLGKTYLLVGEPLKTARASHKGLALHWKFSKTSGWYVTVDKGKRRLFYLFPKPGGFLLKMTFNDRALELIRNSTLPVALKASLGGAKKYPEGTLLEFTPETLTAVVLSELLKVKLAG